MKSLHNNPKGLYVNVLFVITFTLLLWIMLEPLIHQRFFSRRMFVFDSYGKIVPHAKVTFRNGSGFPIYHTVVNAYGISNDPIAISLAHGAYGEYQFQEVIP